MDSLFSRFKSVKGLSTGAFDNLHQKWSNTSLDSSFLWAKSGKHNPVYQYIFQRYNMTKFWWKKEEYKVKRQLRDMTFVWSQLKKGYSCRNSSAMLYWNYWFIIGIIALLELLIAAFLQFQLRPYRKDVGTSDFQESHGSRHNGAPLNPLVRYYRDVWWVSGGPLMPDRYKNCSLELRWCVPDAFGLKWGSS